MTIEKLKTAVANINAYLSECPDDDDTITLTVNVIRSVKENYEELIEARAEIEALKAEVKAANQYCKKHCELKYKAEIEGLRAFKSYFDNLYGEGLDIANWHKNGDLEPFDSFYDSAIEEMVGE